MPIFRSFFKRRILRKMIAKMSPELIKGYGSREFYSCGQVIQTSKRVNASKRYLHYNVALFCNELDEQASKKLDLTQAELNKLRVELANKIFSGEEYTAMDILKLVAPSQWKGGAMEDDFSNRYGMNSRY